MDKKMLAAFLGGGALIGGLVWMVSRPEPITVPPPAEVVSEVREVPQIHDDGQTSEAPVATQRGVQRPAKPTPKSATAKPVASAPTNASPSAPTSASSSSGPSSKAPEAPAPPVYTEPRREPSVSQASRNEPQPTPVKKRAPNRVTISAGTPLEVRLADKLSSGTNAVGDGFQGTLDKALVVDGLVIAEKGAKVDGTITSLDRGGRVKGVAEIHLELTSMRTADGQTVKITTDSFVKQAATSKKEDAAKVGIGAGSGAAIGAIIGGGKGAAIGAGAGGAAGAGTVIATRGKDAVLPVETQLTFHLGAAVTVTEKIE